MTLADLWAACPEPGPAGAPVVAAVDVLPGGAGLEFAVAAPGTAYSINVEVDAAPAADIQGVLQGLVDRDPAMVLLGLAIHPDDWEIPAPTKRCGSHQTRRWLPVFESLLHARRIRHAPGVPPTKAALWAACWLAKQVSGAGSSRPGVGERGQTWPRTS